MPDGYSLFMTPASLSRFRYINTCKNAEFMISPLPMLISIACQAVSLFPSRSLVKQVQILRDKILSKNFSPMKYASKINLQAWTKTCQTRAIMRSRHSKTGSPSVNKSKSLAMRAHWKDPNTA